MSFQKIILLIATILLIVVLIVFGLTIKNSNNNVKYPPVSSQCPDYWKASKGKNGISMCENVKKLGDSKCQTEMNFSVKPYTGTHGICTKKKWATRCGITWDGVTNNTKTKC